MEWKEKIPLGRQDLQDLIDFLSQRFPNENTEINPPISGNKLG